MSTGPDRGPAALSRAAAVIVALLAALPGAASDPREERVEIADVDLEDLLDVEVEAVSRHAERAALAPASVFVLTADDLRAHGFRTLGDALAVVPGLFTYRDGLFRSAGVRGLGLPGDYDTRLLVLVDGHPLTNALGLGQSYVERDLPVPLEAVARVEVILGPAGGVYGPTAFLGVVNVVTGASGREARAGGDAAQGRVRGGEAAARAAGGAEIEHLVAVSGAWAGGPDPAFPELAGADRPAPPGGRVEGAGFERAASGYARVRWRSVAAAAGCGWLARGLPSSPYSALVGDRRNRLSTLTCFADARWGGAGPGGLRWGVHASADAFEFKDAFAYDPPPEDVGVFRDVGHDRWVSAGARLDWTAGFGLRLSGGADGALHDTLQRSFVRGTPSLVEDPVNGVGLGAIEKDFGTLNLWAQAEQPLGRVLTLHGAVSFSANGLFADRLTPRAAAVLAPGPDDVLKAVWSEGFRAPTAAEAYYEDGTDFLANPALRPERVTSLEVAWERRLGARATAALAAFHNRYRSLIRFVTVPAPGLPGPPDPARPEDFRQVGANVDGLRLTGAQATVRLRAGGLSAWAGLSVQGADGETRPNLPAYTATLAASGRVPFWRPLLLAASASALARRARDETALAPGTPRHVPAALRLDARAAVDVPRVRGLTVELAAENLLDAEVLHPVTGDFAPITAVPDPPRTVRLSVGWAAP
jgi:iron complex outermembrane receptor protein